MSQSFSFDINSFDTAVNVWNIADSRSQILTWLSPLEPTLRHKDIRDRRVECVGEWLLQTKEFISWYAGDGGGESDNAVLFCYGDPGVGKTYISSLVIDSLCDRARGQNVAVACFYFDSTAQKEQSSTSMLGALLKQVVKGLEEVPGEVAQAYEYQKRVIGGRGPQLSDIVKVLQTTSSAKRTFICIDALDECAVGHQVKLLDSLNKILRKSPGTRIFVTGRPHIQAEIREHLSRRVATIAITTREGDVIRYLCDMLGGHINPDAMDSGLEADILKKISEDVSETFLLASLNIDAVLQETTIYRRREKLNAMTKGLGLGDTYGAALDRIKGQGGEKARLGMAALMWISHAERQLNPDELCHALAVEIGSPNLNVDNVPSIGLLLPCCQGLVIVDKESSTIRLIHFTLQEYLQARPELFGTAHSTIAETCLSYLNSQQVKALSTSPHHNLQSTPFLEYSSLYWGMHAKIYTSDCAKLLALKLFNDCKNHIAVKTLLKAQGRYAYNVDFNKISLFSCLHCASIFGIEKIVASLVEAEGCDINQEDCAGNTPLVWAARNGHGGVVKILLGRGDVNPDKPNEYGQTPLGFAAENGHEGVIEILLERGDVNRDGPDEDGQTPLSYAAENGHEGVVKILLGQDNVNPDKPDEYGQTPLCRAAENGHGGVVKILLAQGDVSPDKPDGYGRTPLWCAAWNGHEEVVEVLLARDDVNSDKPDEYGRTPLWWASGNGHEEVVKILLGRDDVNPDRPDKSGRTPLWWATKNRHTRVIALLQSPNSTTHSAA